MARQTIFMSTKTTSAATIAGETGIPERTAQRILSQQGVAYTPGEGYVRRDAVRAIVSFYRTAADRPETPLAKDRARKARAEADIAELAATRARGEVCMLADAKAWWNGERIEVKRTIERAEFLTPTQKTRLLTAFSKIKTKPPEADTNC